MGHSLGLAVVPAAGATSLPLRARPEPEAPPSPECIQTHVCLSSSRSWVARDESLAQVGSEAQTRWGAVSGQSPVGSPAPHSGPAACGCVGRSTAKVPDHTIKARLYRRSYSGTPGKCEDLERRKEKSSNVQWVWLRGRAVTASLVIW